MHTPKEGNIQVGNNEEILAQKDNIEVSEIFGEKPSGKTFDLGKPGEGQNSFIHFISYKWPIISSGTVNLTVFSESASRI
jgi:hypothetical protein